MHESKRPKIRRCEEQTVKEKATSDQNYVLISSIPKWDFQKFKIELFQVEEDLVPKIFDPIYSAVKESLKTINDKYLADSLPSKDQ